jgi:hypothetical protein
MSNCVSQSGWYIVSLRVRFYPLPQNNFDKIPIRVRDLMVNWISHGSLHFEFVVVTNSQNVTAFLTIFFMLWPYSFSHHRHISWRSVTSSAQRGCEKLRVNLFRLKVKADISATFISFRASLCPPPLTHCHTAPPTARNSYQRWVSFKRQSNIKVTFNSQQSQLI